MKNLEQHWERILKDIANYSRSIECYIGAARIKESARLLSLMSEKGITADDLAKHIGIKKNKLMPILLGDKSLDKIKELEYYVKEIICED